MNLYILSYYDDWALKVASSEKEALQKYYEEYEKVIMSRVEKGDADKKESELLLLDIKNSLQDFSVELVDKVDGHKIKVI